MDTEKLIVRKEFRRLQQAARILAMLALQSDRYQKDPDYRDAVDNVLALIGNIVFF